jgi:hypothetical protein
MRKRIRSLSSFQRATFVFNDERVVSIRYTIRHVNIVNEHIHRTMIRVSIDDRIQLLSHVFFSTQQEES